MKDVIVSSQTPSMVSCALLLAPVPPMSELLTQYRAGLVKTELQKKKTQTTFPEE